MSIDKHLLLFFCILIQKKKTNILLEFWNSRMYKKSHKKSWTMVNNYSKKLILFNMIQYYSYMGT